MHPNDSRSRAFFPPNAGPEPATRSAAFLGGLRRKVWLAVLAAALLLAVPGGAYLLLGGGLRGQRTDLVTHTVRLERLELAIVERGALESADNRDIICRVKSGSKGSSFSTTIKWVIDDGSLVQEGDLLVELDDAGLLDQEKTQKIAVDQAEALKVQAEENYKIVVKQNESDIQTAEVALQLAKIDQLKYRDADYAQSLKDVQGRLKLADSDLEMLRERASWSERMLKKGYLSRSQVEAENAKLRSGELLREKVQEELRVLDYTKRRTETDLDSKVREAERALVRVQAQADAKEKQALIDRNTRQKIYDQEVDRLKDVQTEIKKCKIHAPQDGMVVYFLPDSSRFGSSSRTSIVAQGEPVSEGQKLMRIPNLTHMQVNVKVHEALISRVTSGQPSTVRVDAFPNRQLRGRVKQVATVASQNDFFSSDVKVYQTLVALDETLDGLKPGMSAEVNIQVGADLENVVTIPVQAVWGGADLGRSRKCFVRTADGVQERDIVIGQSNDRMVEIKSGLAVGEDVVINPKVLLGDKVRTRQPAAEKPAVNGGDDFQPEPPAPKGEPGKGGKRPPGAGGKGKLPPANMPERAPQEKAKSAKD
ncbi:MAG: efflux RND transporter periplasmic adaptor subunit [Planctomycetia bacterium]|nr:efflux RND transporter periplasmic adaptor subunit [Planctomycetia bacterium]